MTQINNAIITSKSSGMILMDTFLENLAKQNLISKEEACDRAVNSTTMMQQIAQ
jgi:Tfp pilus assembly pilus retraction ATPase PilT